MNLTSAYDLANWWKCCIERHLQAVDADPVQAYVGVAEVAWDDCCGQLVIAPERVFRSVDFPAENTGEEFCYGGELVVNLVALLVRCVPTVDDRGRAPSAKALDDAHKAFLRDAATVWRAVTCCDMPEDWERSSVAQTFVGAQGGCVAVETRWTVGVNQQVWEAA